PSRPGAPLGQLRDLGGGEELSGQPRALGRAVRRLFEIAHRGTSLPRPGAPGIAALRDVLRICDPGASGKACDEMGKNMWITEMCGGTVGARWWRCGWVAPSVGAAGECVAAGRAGFPVAGVGSVRDGG